MDTAWACIIHDLEFSGSQTYARPSSALRDQRCACVTVVAVCTLSSHGRDMCAETGGTLQEIDDDDMALSSCDGERSIAPAVAPARTRPEGILRTPGSALRSGLSFSPLTESFVRRPVRCPFVSCARCELCRAIAARPRIAVVGDGTSAHDCEAAVHRGVGLAMCECGQARGCSLQQCHSMRTWSRLQCCHAPT